ncbi:MAG: 1-acyl-sn-glycerol-3-phosphate acyltransferase, partial [Myxococcota bacterium]
QERLLSDLRKRVVRQAQDNRGGHGRLDERIADSVYHEERRLSQEGSSRKSARDAAFFGEVRRNLRGSGDKTQVELLERLIDHYGGEIAGHFDERVYRLVTRAALPALGALLRASSPKRLLTELPSLSSLEEVIKIQGHYAQLRRLHELGTVVLVPTHVSNLDSLVVGYALWRLGLPPFLYGAGLNLFSNPMMGFFLHNLGAYTVDRRKEDPLYREVLKEYCTLTLEYGYDNIFFPGGTRSRSGAIERKLKLGLLGCGLRAFIHNLQHGKSNPRVYIVPATISMQLVLEAETLIDDFLKEQGKSRYIISDDEFSQPTRILDFVRQLLSMDSRIHLTIGQAFDPFGNTVDEEGESLDPHGRIIDPAYYTFRKGSPEAVSQRDAEYTRELAEKVTECFASHSLIQSTHVTARALFDILRLRHQGTELIRVLRMHNGGEEFSLREVYDRGEVLLSELRALAQRGAIRLSPLLQTGATEDVIADGLAHFSTYHKRAAARRRGDHLLAADKPLLFYYQNRLEGYRLERSVGLPPALGDDHRSLRGCHE